MTMTTTKRKLVEEKMRSKVRRVRRAKADATRTARRKKPLTPAGGVSTFRCSCCPHRSHQHQHHHPTRRREEGCRWRDELKKPRRKEASG